MFLCVVCGEGLSDVHLYYVTTLNIDGVDVSHDSEMVSHDPHEDGSHDLVAEQTSSSSDITANQNEVDMTD